MDAPADAAYARSMWPDAGNLPDDVLASLLTLAWEACERYVPTDELTAAPAPVPAGIHRGSWFWDTPVGPGAIHHDGTSLTVALTDRMGEDRTALVGAVTVGDVFRLTDPAAGEWWQWSVKNPPNLHPTTVTVPITSPQHDAATAEPTLGTVLSVDVLRWTETAPVGVPERWKLANVQHARDAWTATRRDTGDVLGFDQYAVTVRPLSGSVRALLRPARGVPLVG